ncbi:hypothetical protein CAEBREN_22637 [Caenorhabditis brenneri]|uniref:Serpentine receptor class r-10 n=1 Tax=Caenorhabditis brenneri TaxID=135651 RepID=G0PF76_CAEBE|nr:hypothetical protein CAEBREN_22637 [Caenorhabditis brenneri]
MNKIKARDFEAIKFAFQSISVVFSWLINLSLIYLILTKSPKKMGNYRHLMIYFCCFSIFFSSMDIIVQPNIHTYKSAFFMVMDYRSRGIPLWMAEILICTMCGCFGTTIYGIAVHFIYRLFALERTTVKEFFDLEIDDCAYAGAAFYPYDKNGVRIISDRSFMGFALFLIVMTIPFVVVIFAGGKSYLIIRALLKQGESRYSKNLQMQLYKALVAQTFIPILLLFIPFGTIFILPIFEIDCQFLSAPITFVYALYPAVDPLPILFFVDYYRIAVSNFFDSLRCKTARVGVYEEESSRSNNRV